MSKYLDIDTLLTKFAVLNKNIRIKIQSNELQGEKELRIELSKSTTKMLDFKYGEQVCSSMVLKIDKDTDPEFFKRCIATAGTIALQRVAVGRADGFQQNRLKWRHVRHLPLVAWRPSNCRPWSGGRPAP